MEINDNTFLRQFETKAGRKLAIIEYSVQERKIFLTKIIVPEIKNKVFIMHGSNDSMVPFTESIELHRSIEASSLFVSYMYEHKEISTDKGIIFKVKEFYKMFKFFKGYFKYNES